MNLSLSEEQELLRDTFAELFRAESSPARVRAAEPLGFDAALWKQLAETGAIAMRVPEAMGGGGASLLDAALVAEQAGRRLASAPLVEAIVAGSVLASQDAKSWLARLADGSAVVSLLPRPARAGAAPLVPAGGVADAVITLVGSELLLIERGSGREPALPNLGSSPLARWRLDDGPRQLLASGAEARTAFERAAEEWKLLTAASLVGLAREALEIAARYASERKQFGRPIGAFQGVAHPLADSAADVDGARLLVWRAIWAIARGRSDAAASLAMAFWWACQAATSAVAKALHTHGGYGLSLEYDVQLYHRRGKAWAAAAGDPQDELLRVAERLWGGGEVALPAAGECGLEFELPDSARTLAAEARRFFAENLTPELRAHAGFTWEGHHPGFQRQLAEAGLLFPAWPRQYGGRESGPYDMLALAEAFHEAGWTRHAIATTDMVAQTLMRFASEELLAEVLPRIARGDAIASLGYSEPGSGSDVAGAQTRAIRDGDHWRIDGQKMFTSGANLAQYVFLLTRTDPDAAKHRGLTMFLVPLDTPGIQVQAVHTLSGERTNITYYSGVRVPDRCRVGPVNGGWTVVAAALDLEHGGGMALEQRTMLAAAVDWARATEREGRPALADPRVAERLARVAVHAEVADLLGLRNVFARVSKLEVPGAGPMAKLFGPEHFIRDAADLVDLLAPESLLTGEGGPGALEFAYRLSTATSIYGGTSEIMRSIIAQASLGLPRSRS